MVLGQSRSSDVTLTRTTTDSTRYGRRAIEVPRGTGNVAQNCAGEPTGAASESEPPKKRQPSRWSTTAGSTRRRSNSTAGGRTCGGATRQRPMDKTHAGSRTHAGSSSNPRDRCPHAYRVAKWPTEIGRRFPNGLPKLGGVFQMAYRNWAAFSMNTCTSASRGFQFLRRKSCTSGCPKSN